MAAICRSRNIADARRPPAPGRRLTLLVLGALAALAWAPPAHARPQSPAHRTAPAGRTEHATKPPTPPPGYLIGPSDVLDVVFWRDKDMSAEVIVRPDGMISLPLLNDVKAAGLTPEQLGDELVARAKKFIDDPNATVVVKEIHSRKVYITGQIAKPGAYALAGHTTVLQLISTAGGLTEFAHDKAIVIMRLTGGRQRRYLFNYRDVVRGKHVEQDIELEPGDTIVVP